MSRILVIGAHGTVGSVLARLLAAQGETVVKATSRPPTAANERQLDVVSRSGLQAAFDGIDRAFLLAPPGHANQDELLAPLIDESRARGLEKVVLMSAMGADADEAAPLRKAERRLQASGLAHTIIRPNWFMQNFNTFWLQGIREHGKIFLPVGTAKGSFIDARDIAAVAAELLTAGGHDGRDIDLTGPAAIDHDEAAAILTRETGRPIAFEDITPAAMLDGLLGAGVPRPYAEFMIVILGYFQAGYAERTTGAVAEILGREPGSFAQYAKDYRASWLASSGRGAGA